MIPAPAEETGPGCAGRGVSRTARTGRDRMSEAGHL